MLGSDHHPVSFHANVTVPLEPDDSHSHNINGQVYTHPLPTGSCRQRHAGWVPVVGQRTLTQRNLIQSTWTPCAVDLEAGVDVGLTCGACAGVVQVELVKVRVKLLVLGVHLFDENGAKGGSYTGSEGETHTPHTAIRPQSH